MTAAGTAALLKPTPDSRGREDFYIFMTTARVARSTIQVVGCRARLTPGEDSVAITPLS